MFKEANFCVSCDEVVIYNGLQCGLEPNFHIKSSFIRDILTVRFSAKSWLQKPAFLMLSSIWFQPENHLRSQEKQSHSCLLPQLCFIFELPAYPTGPDLHCPFIKASYSKCLFVYIQKFPVRQTSFMLNLKNWGWRWNSYQFQNYLFDLATSRNKTQ